jgi:hypothetical protein
VNEGIWYAAVFLTREGEQRRLPPIVYNADNKTKIPAATWPDHEIH